MQRSSISYYSYILVRGIDYMKENYPDYKGEDLFGEFNEEDKDNIL